MTTEAPATETRKKLISVMAEAAQIDEKKFLEAVRRRVAPEADEADLILFLHMAHEHGLDPLATPPQIGLFVSKRGTPPKPYVQFDGWLKILMSHPLYYDHWFSDEVWSGGQRGKGTLDSVTFNIEKWDREKKERVVRQHSELLIECREKGEYTPWNKWPCRMLKEKTAMQGTRFILGIYIPDLDDAMQGETLEAARAEGGVAAPVVPIAPAAPISGARRAHDIRRSDEAIGATGYALPAPTSVELELPKKTEERQRVATRAVESQSTAAAPESSAVPETAQGTPRKARADVGPRADPQPGNGGRSVDTHADPAPLPPSARRDEPARMPEYDPAASLAVDRELDAQAKRGDGLFDDLDL